MKKTIFVSALILLFFVQAFAGGHTVTINSIDLLCNGGNHGSAWATVSGGTGPFAYSWSNGVTGATGISLTAGTYSCTVIDNNDLSSVNASVTITEPGPIISATSSTDATNGQSNGSASIASAGGVGSYTCSWSTGATGIKIFNLSCGTYTVTVKDANGCIATSTAVVNCVTGINELDDEIDYIIYPNPTTTIITIETSANKAYTLQLINLFGETVYNTIEIATGKTTIDVGTLPKGVYLVQLIDKVNSSIGRQRVVVQ